MKPALKWGIAGAAGIAIALAIKNSSDENEETEQKAQLALQQLDNTQLALKQLVDTTGQSVTIPYISAQELIGKYSDGAEARKALLNYIIEKYPQQCIFQGIWKPSWNRLIFGYKYDTSQGNNIYIGLQEFSIDTGNIVQFGYNNGVYYERIK